MGLVAKRIEHAANSQPPKLIIKSVNPQYDTYQRDAEEVHLIGRGRLGGEAAVRRFPHDPLKRAQWTGIPTRVAGAVLSALNIGSVAARLVPLRISSVLWSAVRWIFRDPDPPPAAGCGARSPQSHLSVGDRLGGCSG